MAITDESRHRLYQRLEEVLGSEQAATLMEHLPPVGWADVATKRDLDMLKSQLDARFEAVDTRFGAVEARIDASANAVRADLQRDLRLQLLAILGANTALFSLAVAVTRFL